MSNHILSYLYVTRGAGRVPIRNAYEGDKRKRPHPKSGEVVRVCVQLQGSSVDLEKIANCASSVLIGVDVLSLKEFRESGDNDFSLHTAGRQGKQFNVVIKRGRYDERDPFAFVFGGHYETRGRQRGRVRAVGVRQNRSGHTVSGDSVSVFRLLQPKHLQCDRSYI
jgi:hypothetical protein